MFTIHINILTLEERKGEAGIVQGNVIIYDKITFLYALRFYMYF